MMVNNKGFTLLELLVTVAVLAILLVVGVPSFDSFIKKSHANNTVQGISKTFNFARGQALSLASAVTVCHIGTGNKCDGDWTGALTVFVDIDRDRVLDNGEDILLVTDALDTDDVLDTTAVSGVMFLPDGRLSAANNFTLKFCPGSATSKYSRGFIMSLTGRIRHSMDTDGDDHHELDGDKISCSV